MNDTTEIMTVQEQLPHRDHGAEYHALDPSIALERLRNGERLERVRISRLKLEGEFAKSIEMVNVVLDRPDIRRATFHAPVTFSRCEINGLSFSHGPVVFEQSLSFKSCHLKRPRLDYVTIKGELSFDNSELHGGIKLAGCELKGTHAWETKFLGWVDVKKCTVRGIADFRSAHAAEGVMFYGCDFQGDILFRGMSCTKKLDLSDSKCAALVDLSKAKLHDFVYLEGMQAGPNQRFAFLNAVADRILIRPDQVQGRLQSELAGNFAEARQEYGLLKASYQTLHRFDDEDWALHQFKINQRRAKPRSWSRPWTKLAQLCDLVFLDWGCGYGTKPNRAVLTALVLMLAFALIYAAGIEHFEIVQPPIREWPAEHWANRLLFGMLTTVSVFTSGFGGDPLRQAHGWVLVPLACEALLGTLLWGLFVVAFSRKVIR